MNKDLKTWSAQGHLFLVLTDIADSDSRRRDSIEDERYRWWRGRALTFASIALLCSVAVMCIWTIFLNQEADADRRQTALGILPAMIGAFAGFLIRRAAK